jgi:hypothetical protein
MTLDDPLTMTSGGPTQTQVSEIRAEGKKPIKTVISPVMIGPPTWGIGGVPGVAIGQVCISVILAAGGIYFLL